MTRARTRGSVAVVGIGESTYYRREQSPDDQFVLALKAILAACVDAGLDPRDIDGFVSFANDENEPRRLSAALGIHELRWSTMQWMGGGAGGSGAVQQAVAAITCGHADAVIVHRALTQKRRFGGPIPGRRDFSYMAPYGMLSAAQMFAVRANRFFHESGVALETQRAVALASYYHAQQNPRAVMHGRPLTEAAYNESRWIAEPFRLFDCCQETDGAAALLLVSAERARSFAKEPVFVLGAAQGSAYRADAPALNAPDFGTAEFKTVVPRLYEAAEIKAADIDVVQAYENFTAGVVMSLIEHQLCSIETANEVLTLENLIAPNGKLPINTSGGNLAECYVHGLELHVEAVRQLRGESSNQVAEPNVALVASGPMTTPATSSVLGTEATL